METNRTPTNLSLLLMVGAALLLAACPTTPAPGGPRDLGDPDAEVPQEPDAGPRGPADAEPEPDFCGDRTQCGDSCIDLDSNPLHCGACDNACGAFEQCSFGECVGDCEGMTVCDGACVDTATDNDNCGGCGSVCDGTCLDGVCCGEPGSGDLACGDQCVNYAFDEENCGGCGVQCAELEQCAFGVCLNTCTPTRNPTEVCDDQDNDCDGVTDFPDCRDDLVGWYRFEESSGNIIDSSGHGNHGAVIGGVIRDREGKRGRAIRIDGARNSGISIPNSDSLTFGDQITLEAWVNIDTCDRADHTIFSRFEQFRLGVDSGGHGCDDEGALKFEACNFYGCRPWDEIRRNDAPRFVPGRWTHIAMVYDGRRSGEWTLYHNGEVSLVRTFNMSLMQTDEGILIGRLPNGDHAFQGHIDELKIFRTARPHSAVCTDAGGNYSTETGHCDLRRSWLR